MTNLTGERGQVHTRTAEAPTKETLIDSVQTNCHRGNAAIPMTMVLAYVFNPKNFNVGEVDMEEL